SKVLRAWGTWPHHLAALAPTRPGALTRRPQIFPSRSAGGGAATGSFAGSSSGMMAHTARSWVAGPCIRAGLSSRLPGGTRCRNSRPLASAGDRDSQDVARGAARGGEGQGRDRARPEVGGSLDGPIFPVADAQPHAADGRTGGRALGGAQPHHDPPVP